VKLWFLKPWPLKWIGILWNCPLQLNRNKLLSISIFLKTPFKEVDVNILTYHYFDFGRVILAYELKQTQMDFIRIAKCINAEMIRIIYIYTINPRTNNRSFKYYYHFMIDLYSTFTSDKLCDHAIESNSLPAFKQYVFSHTVSPLYCLSNHCLRWPIS
jgi:hypothetical protein